MSLSIKPLSVINTRLVYKDDLSLNDERFMLLAIECDCDIHGGLKNERGIAPSLW